MFINFTIIITFTKFEPSAALIELKDAGAVLKQLLGDSAKYIWALGLFASGQSATMAGAITGQYIFEGFFNLRIVRWKRILISRLISLAPCILIGMFANVEFVYIILNIVQFIQLPFVLIPLFKFIRNDKLMNGFRVNRLYLVFLEVMSVGFVMMNFYQIWFNIPKGVNLFVVFLFVTSIYVILLYKMMRIPIIYKESVNLNIQTFSSLEC